MPTTNCSMPQPSEMKRRLVEEVAKCGSTSSIANKFDCPEVSVWRWKKGKQLPDAYNLALLYGLGCDVIYILTGERTR